MGKEEEEPTLEELQEKLKVKDSITSQSLLKFKNKDSDTVIILVI